MTGDLLQTEAALFVLMRGIVHVLPFLRSRWSSYIQKFDTFLIVSMYHSPILSLPPLSLSLTHTHTQTHSLKSHALIFLSLFIFWQFTFSSSLIQKKLRQFCFSLSTHTHTHTHTYTYTYTHTHTGMCSHSHTQVSTFKLIQKLAHFFLSLFVSLSLPFACAHKHTHTHTHTHTNSALSQCLLITDVFSYVSLVKHNRCHGIWVPTALCGLGCNSKTLQHKYHFSHSRRTMSKQHKVIPKSWWWPTLQGRRTLSDVTSGNWWLVE